MNSFTLVAVVACLSFASAQLDTTGTGSQSAFTTSNLGAGILTNGGPLAYLSGQGGSGTSGGLTSGTDLTTSTGLTAGTGLTADSGAGATGTTNPTLPTNPVNSMFSNPMLAYGMMGGDNMMRAMMAPYMSRVGGNLGGLYYLRGGMDTFSKVYMANMMKDMLSRSTGMNPVVSAFLTGQMTDAPDGYALSNMIMNGGFNGRRQGQGGSSPNSVGGNGGLGALALLPFLGM